MPNVQLKEVPLSETPKQEPVPIKPDQEIFTIQEAAAFLRVGRKVIDEAIRKKRLKVIQLGRSRRALRIYKGDLLGLRAPVV